MNKWLRRGALSLGALLLVGIATAGGLFAKARMRLSEQHRTHTIDLALPDAADAAAVARGKHLVEARYGCVACHGGDFGGGTMLDDPAIGRILGPNITRGAGSATASYDMSDWDRIVRHGIKPDGTASLMPSVDFFKMSDEELLDIVAYARSLPLLSKRTPPPELGPVGTALVALGKLPLSAELPSPLSHPRVPPAARETQEFGEHLSGTCITCHGANLAGGPLAFGPPDWPPASNLTSHSTGLGEWSFEDFERALVSGTSKDGRKLRPPMSEVISGTRGMSSTERKALWLYLRSLPQMPSSPG